MATPLASSPQVMNQTDEWDVLRERGGSELFGMSRRRSQSIVGPQKQDLKDHKQAEKSERIAQAVINPHGHNTSVKKPLPPLPISGVGEHFKRLSISAAQAPQNEITQQELIRRAKIQALLDEIEGIATSLRHVANVMIIGPKDTPDERAALLETMLTATNFLTSEENMWLVQKHVFNLAHKLYQIDVYGAFLSKAEKKQVEEARTVRAEVVKNSDERLKQKEKELKQTFKKLGFEKPAYKALAAKIVEFRLYQVGLGQYLRLSKEQEEKNKQELLHMIASLVHLFYHTSEVPMQSVLLLNLRTALLLDDASYEHFLDKIKNYEIVHRFIDHELRERAKKLSKAQALQVAKPIFTSSAIVDIPLGQLTLSLNRLIGKVNVKVDKQFIFQKSLPKGELEKAAEGKELHLGSESVQQLIASVRKQMGWPQLDATALQKKRKFY